MFNYIKDYLKPLSAQDKARADTAFAEHQLLVHEAEAMLHEKMAEYYRETISRLNGYIKKIK